MTCSLPMPYPSLAPHNLHSPLTFSPSFLPLTISLLIKPMRSSTVVAVAEDPFFEADTVALTTIPLLHGSRFCTQAFSFGPERNHLCLLVIPSLEVLTSNKAKLVEYMYKWPQVLHSY
ncbi:uncharacterized protein LOC110271658 [Arachis ipaensis]|uniref:uncharacterized protein LOC110271658 n=1 Tax=Arachis ipaensis TaxID=130454 RepID=UPI000A2AF538|nr:uncharacterized protein LOC110271658 [Arachis ipaensis]XP_025651022.1 uncharacterized protein LOC112747283 [Arachis hypogaea]